MSTDNAFMAALKAKSDASRNRALTPIRAAAPAPAPAPAPIHYIDHTGKPAKYVAPVEAPAPIDDPIVVTVERVLNRDRLDVFFSRKPSKAILDLLHRAKFWHRPSDKAWYNKDTAENRSFCELNFGADFGNDDDSTVHLNGADIDTATSTQNVNDQIDLVAEASQIMIPVYEQYKQQVNELIEHLKIEASDLQLIAIDLLHKKTFSKDS